MPTDPTSNMSAHGWDDLPEPVQDILRQVHIVRHAPECSTVDEGSCFTPWCRCECHGDFIIHGHEGDFMWRNAAEMVWECADNCPHPNHDHEGR